MPPEHHLGVERFDSDGRLVERYLHNTPEQVRIVEIEKTKRIGLVLATLLLICGLLVPIFAPPEKQTMSYWVGGSMLIFAAGAAGFSILRVRNEFLDIAASKNPDERLADGLPSRAPGDEKSQISK